MTPSKVTSTLQPHPRAERIPLPTQEEYIRLRDDIAENGQHLPIVLYEGRILDGRTRYRACQELGIEPMIREFDPNVEGSPLAFVISMNYNRRDLSDAQKATIRAENVADLRAEGMTNEAIAKVLGVSEWTVRSDQKKRRLVRVGQPEDDGFPNRGDLDSESAGQGPEPNTIISKRGDKRPGTYARKPKAKQVEHQSTRRLKRSDEGADEARSPAHNEDEPATQSQPARQSSSQKQQAKADNDLVKSLQEAVKKHRHESGLRETFKLGPANDNIFNEVLDYLVKIDERRERVEASGGFGGQTISLGS
jgi:hypothetical protein